MTLTKERIVSIYEPAARLAEYREDDTLHWKILPSEMRELCRLALANLETQEKHMEVREYIRRIQELRATLAERTKERDEARDREGLADFGFSAEKARADALASLLERLKTGACWCEVGIGNPMLAGRHAQVCLDVQAALRPSGE
jgi:hypothetical protein